MDRGERVKTDKALVIFSGMVSKHPLSKPSVCIRVELNRSDCMGSIIRYVIEATQDTMSERQLIHDHVGKQGDVANSSFKQVCLDDKELKPTIKV